MKLRRGLTVGVKVRKRMNQSRSAMGGSLENCERPARN